MGNINPVSKDEVDMIIILMKELAPQDMLEVLYCSQIVVCNMLAMRKMAQGHREDERIGICLFKICTEAMNGLERKRSGSPPNVAINYSYAGGGDALMQTVVENCY